MVGTIGGLQEETRSENILVSTTSIEVASPRTTESKRKIIYIRNVSLNAADILSLGFGDRQGAIINTGIQLRQNETYIESIQSGFEPYQGRIQIICATVNGVIALFER